MLIAATATAVAVFLLGRRRTGGADSGRGIDFVNGALASVYNTVCANNNLRTTPAGELLGAPDLIGANLAAIHNVGPTPVKPKM